MAGFTISGDMIIPIIIVVIIAVGIWYLWKRFIGSKSKTQPITKDQYERLTADKLISCRNNRIKNTKWINITGDSIHPPIRHYAKYWGSVVDARGVWLAWKVKWWTPKRQGPVTWDLIDNFGGREIWVDSNGFDKVGYFMIPTITADHCKSKKYTVQKYHLFFKELIKCHLGLQSLHDTFEQVAYEIQSASAHKERAMTDLMTVPEYPEYRESEQEFPREPEG